jgi:putative tryptophan/tyrosine transport system substrate-binding protein
MKRREFIILVGGAAAAWSSQVRAQQPAMPTIGWLHLGSERPVQGSSIGAFRSGLAALGYREGKNIRVLYRYADGNADRLPALTLELVSLGATIIVTSSTIAIRAAHYAAPNVPIVSRSAAGRALRISIFSAGGPGFFSVDAVLPLSPVPTATAMTIHASNTPKMHASSTPKTATVARSVMVMSPSPSAQLA